MLCCAVPRGCCVMRRVCANLGYVEKMGPCAPAVHISSTCIQPLKCSPAPAPGVQPGQPGRGVQVAAVAAQVPDALHFRLPRQGEVPGRTSTFACCWLHGCLAACRSLAALSQRAPLGPLLQAVAALACCALLIRHTLTPALPALCADGLPDWQHRGACGGAPRGGQPAVQELPLQVRPVRVTAGRARRVCWGHWAGMEGAP